MVQRAIVVGAVLVAAGCEERMFSFAGYWVAADLPAGGARSFLVSADATPAAWPPNVEGQAARLAFTERDGAASSPDVRITVLGRESHEVDFGVSVLDLFEGCNPRQACHDAFTVTLTCEAAAGCEGEFGGDAYVSTRQPGRDAPNDALSLWIEPLVAGPEPTVTSTSVPTP